jgi:hypothetical protein
MKLTALAGGKTRFELFVIADNGASSDALTEEFCDRFAKTDNKEWTDDGWQAQSRCVGATSNCKIGHSAICSLMWDKCVLTKLVGTIDAANMTKDLVLASKPFKAHQEHFFTRYGAGCAAVVIVVLMIGIGNILSMRDYAKGLVQPRGFLWYCWKRLLPVSAVALLVAGAFGAIVPKLGDSEIRVSRRLVHVPGTLLERFEDRLTQDRELLKRSEQEIADSLRKKPNAWTDGPTKNPLTGGEVQVEDSPGNFTVEKQAGRVVLRAYDQTGAAAIKVLPLEPPGKQGDASPTAGSGR